MGRFFVPSIMFSALLGQAASHTDRNCALLLFVLICFVLGVCPLALGEPVMVPMRDGVKLPTIIALPGSGSYPVVLTRGYTASGLSSHAGRFNKAGYAFEAQTGRRLWRFRLGPAGRRIPVYGKLISTWPVAGGVVVHKGVIYAAAGIAHYDGTYVVALDAVTGKVKWYNDTSGSLSEKVNSGISLQGSLSIQGNELCFTGGGVYQTARYDLKTGKCLNNPHQGLNSRFQTAFYAYFPEYAQYQSLSRGYPDGKLLRYNASYEGSQHSSLALMGPILKTEKKPAARTDRRTDRPTDRRRRQPQRNVIWQDKFGTRFKGFVVSPDVLLAAGLRTAGDKAASSLAAIRIKDGTVIWRKELPAPVVKGGVAVDSKGRIVIALENGKIVCVQ